MLVGDFTALGLAMIQMQAPSAEMNKPTTLAANVVSEEHHEPHYTGALPHLIPPGWEKYQRIYAHAWAGSPAQAPIGGAAKCRSCRLAPPTAPEPGPGDSAGAGVQRGRGTWLYATGPQIQTEGPEGLKRRPVWRWGRT